VFVVIPSASYPTQLGQQLRARYTAQTIQVTNAGVPSEWATDGARRLPGVMASVRPEVLLLLEGANELGAFGIPGISRAATAIETMAREGRTRGARVFLATLPPPRPTGKNALNLAWIQALNDRVKITASGEGAVLVDLYEALNTNVNLYIGADGLHPTEAGYIKMAETFAAAIRANLELR
jgi:lysophospholipase L1-like esterase